MILLSELKMTILLQASRSFFLSVLAFWLLGVEWRFFFFFDRIEWRRLVVYGLTEVTSIHRKSKKFAEVKTDDKLLKRTTSR